MNTELIILIDQTKLKSISDLRSSLRRHESVTGNFDNLKWVQMRNSLQRGKKGDG